MHIDSEGNMELSAEENQDLMDRLDIPPTEYDDPPVAIEVVESGNDVIRFKATNTKTGKFVVLEFESMGQED